MAGIIFRVGTAMLDAFIIEEIKRRERDRSADDRPVVELPLPPTVPARHDEDVPPGDERDRGNVVIIDYA
jgi:hypothetical protein